MSPEKSGFLFSAAIHIAVLLPLISGSIPFGSDTKPDQQQILTLELDLFSPSPEPEVITEQALVPKIQEQAVIAEEIIKKPIAPIVKPAQPLLPIESTYVPEPLIKQIQPVIVDKPDALVNKTDGSYILLLEKQYTAALKQAIEAQKYYPSRAKRQAREGDVIVGFRINRQGQIKNIHIVSSSSIRILDRAAMSAVSNVGEFKPIPERIKREWWTFEISLSYYLL